MSFSHCRARHQCQRADRTRRKGDIEFGVGTPSFQFPLFAKGQLPPIVNYYEYRSYPYLWDVAVKPDSGAQKYEDLKGKKR